MSKNIETVDNGKDEAVSNSKWRGIVLNRIQKLSDETRSPIFTLTDFNRRFLEELKKEFPDSNSSDSSIRQKLQELGRVIN